MLIPLGILSASGVASTATFELISTTVLASTAASVTFTSLPVGYKHLQFRMAVPSGAGANGTYIRMIFNADSGSNYSRHELWGQGSAVLSNALTSQTAISISGSSGTNASNIADGHILDILDAFNTSKNKTIRNLVGSAPSNISLVSGAWYSTSAVSTILLSAYSQGSASTFAVGSRFSLYGVRG